MYRPVFLFLFVFFTLLSTCSHASSITEQILDSYQEFQLAAFADFNADSVIDLITILPDSSGVEVALIFLNRQPMVERHKSRLRCHFDNLMVINVLPSDYDGDGSVDLAIVTRPYGSVFNRSTAQNDGLTVHILWGARDSLACQLSASPIRLLDQPLAIDYDGDTRTDLAGHQPSDLANSTLTVFHFNATRHLLSERWQHSVSLSGRPVETRQLGAFADINGDMVTDMLVYAGAHFELWTLDARMSGWHVHRVFQPPPPATQAGAGRLGMPILVDMQSSGQLQLVVPVCADIACSDSQLHMYRGAHPAANSTDAAWTRVPLNMTEPGTGVVWRWSVTDEAVTPTSTAYGRVIVAHAGDYNLDGYPDLLTVLCASDNPTTARAFLLLNVAAGDSGSGRGYAVKWDLLRDYASVLAVAFYDVQDDGLLDIFVVYMREGRVMVAVEANRNTFDATFLKVLVLDGRCMNCTASQISSAYPVHAGVGAAGTWHSTNRPGLLSHGYITTTEGFWRHFAAVQLAQAAHFSLQLPAMLYGLGRNPNFVDSLEVSVPAILQEQKQQPSGTRKYVTASRTWSQLIPNCQLVVHPVPLDRPHYWSSKLHVTPGHTIIITLVVLLCTLGVCVCLVVLLHCHERSVDRKQRRQQPHRFNFDAM